MFPFRKMTVPELVTRSRVMTFNPNRPVTAATAPPVAAAADGEQADRDFFWQELLTECRSGRVRPTRLTWLLAESGRSEDELYAALDAANPDEGTPAIPPARQPVRFEKESKMTQVEREKLEATREWNKAVATMHSEHPGWDKQKVISTVVRQDPDLHTRYLNAVNARS